MKYKFSKTHIIYVILFFTVLFSSFQSYQFTSKLDDKALVSDMLHYYVSAQDLTKQGPNRPIGYPFFLWVIFKMFGLSAHHGYYGNIFLSGLSVVLIFLIGRKLSGSLGGLISAVLFAFSKEVMMFQGLLLAEHLQACLVLLLIWFFLSKEGWGKNIFVKILTGMVIGLAIQVKPPIIFLILPFVLLSIFKGLDFFLKDLKHYSITLCVALMCMVGYGVFNKIVHNQFSMYSQSGSINFYVGNNLKANGRLSTQEFRVPIPSFNNSDEENAYQMKKGWEFRKQYPNRVRNLNIVRILNWWTANLDQDGDYHTVSMDQNSKGLFLIPTYILFWFLLPATFLFMTMLCFSTINGTQYNMKNNSYLFVLLVTALLSLGVFYPLVYLTGNIIGNAVLFIMFSLQGVMGLVLFIRFSKEMDEQRLIRFLMFIGVVLFSLLYTLFFFVKLRYRFPTMPFYCISFGVVINDVIRIILAKKSLKSIKTCE